MLLGEIELALAAAQRISGASLNESANSSRECPQVTRRGAGAAPRGSILPGPEAFGLTRSEAAQASEHVVIAAVARLVVQRITYLLALTGQAQASRC